MSVDGKTDLRAFNGRKQMPDYDEKKMAILDSAAHLFAMKGFDGTSVIAITDACNISKSSLYHYFPSKEDILFEVASSFVQEIWSDIDAFDAEKHELPLLEELRTILRICMARFAGGTDRQIVLLNDTDKLPAERRAHIVKLQREVLERVQGLLIRIRPDLVANEEEARVRTMLMFGMLNWTMNWYDPEGSVSPDKLVDIMLDMTFERRPPPATP